MAGAAAFFDLDRTLLRGASAPIFIAALKQAGIVPDRSVPGASLVYRAYELVGETLPGMALARRAATAVTGWSSEAVVAAATEAAKVLTGQVQPFARQLMDEHRAAGRPVVLATTSPFDMVKPFADDLGLDDVVATRYQVDDAGGYTGSLSGGFVWGRGKVAAVRAWCAEHDVDLRASWAYTDSIYDTPLLTAVGHPVAVNPDPRLRLLAAVRRWPTMHLDAPPGVPEIAGVEPWDVLRPLLRPELVPYARFRLTGSEHVPQQGPAIVVANHRSYFDTLAISLAVAPAGRPVRFLAKREVFDAPVVGQLARAMGGIRVERGSGSSEPLEQAARALDAGEIVAMMPQGTIPRGRRFYDPELVGRPGAARLAAMTGAPLVPVGLWGTERVWPRNSRVPRVWDVVSPPLVSVTVGLAFTVPGDDVAADTDVILQRITDLLPAEAHQRRTPTPAEIAAALPPGRQDEEDG